MKPMSCSACGSSCTVYNERHNVCPYCEAKLFPLPEETDPRAEEARDLFRHAKKLGSWQSALFIVPCCFFAFGFFGAFVAVPGILLCWPIGIWVGYRAKRKEQEGREINRQHGFVGNELRSSPPKYAGIVTPQ